jgi:mannose-6-phosphate isomerase
MNHDMLSLLHTRVRRNYRGGIHIDALEGIDPPVVSDRPEEWIASLVPARNPGMDAIEGEGLTQTVVDGRTRFLRDVIQDDSQWWTGRKTAEVGFLFKILDAGMRLHVQAHPTAQFAQAHLGSRFGKRECYYMLDCGPTHEGYIRLGFQHAPSREEWKEIIQTQDIPKMDACFEPIPVHPGEVWMIHGGVPHAIGGGILMLEIMEPSDLVMRCEFEREGIVVPPEARFMHRSLDFCLDIFDYRQYRVDKVRGTFQLQPQTIISQPGIQYDTLVPQSKAGVFEVRRLRLTDHASLTLDVPSALAVLAIHGETEATTTHDHLTLHPAQSAMVAQAAHTLTLTTHTPTSELCLVYDRLGEG